MFEKCRRKKLQNFGEELGELIRGIARSIADRRLCTYTNNCGVRAGELPARYVRMSVSRNETSRMPVRTLRYDFP